MNQKDLTLDDWRLIQNCVVEEIYNIKHRQSYGYEDTLEKLQALLAKIHPLGLSRI